MYVFSEKKGGFFLPSYAFSPSSLCSQCPYHSRGCIVCHYRHPEDAVLIVGKGQSAILYKGYFLNMKVKHFIATFYMYMSET